MGRLLVDYKGCMRHLFVKLLALCSMILILGGCCAHTLVLQHPILTGVEQAQHESQAAVALIVDFAPEQPSFCTGVWVAKDTILTANHCVEGYVEMQHRYFLFQTLIKMGIPEQLAPMFAGIDVTQLTNEQRDSDLGQMLIQLNALFPKLDPMTMTLQYAVPDDITDVGSPPSWAHHAVVQAMYPKLDLALLHVVGNVPAHRIALLADQAPVQGEPVSLVGNTAGQWFSYKQTVVSAIRHLSGAEHFDTQTQGPFIQVMNGLGHGDSGGGLFNQRGQLVGIAEAVDPDTQFGLCIHTDNIRAVLIGQRIIKGKIDIQAQDPDLGDASLNTEN